MAESKLTTEVRTISGVTQVDLRDFGRLTISQAPEETLTIEADVDLFPKITSEIKGDKLVLGIGRDWMERITSGLDFIMQRTVNFKISVKQLQSVHLSGKHELFIDGFDVAKLTLGCSGASEIEVIDFVADTLKVNVSGRAKIHCAGRVEKQSASVSGSCEYQGVELQSQDTSIKISGHSKFRVWAEKSLDVTISGMGSVLYRGTPTLSQRISGAGEVKRIDDMQS